MKIQLNKEVQGLCLCIAVMGVIYALLLSLLALFTGIKLYKTIMVVIIFASLLFTLGLSSQVKSRLKKQVNGFYANKVMS
jgi:hypothetical protein